MVAGGGEMTDGPGTAGAHLTTGLDLEPLAEVDTPRPASDDVRSRLPEGADIDVPVDSAVEYFARVRLRDLLGLVEVRTDEDGGEAEGVKAEVGVGADVLRESKWMFSSGCCPTAGEDDARSPGLGLISPGGAGPAIPVLQDKLAMLPSERAGHCLPQPLVATSLLGAD